MLVGIGMPLASKTEVDGYVTYLFAKVSHIQSLTSQRVCFSSLPLVHDHHPLLLRPPLQYVPSLCVIWLLYDPHRWVLYDEMRVSCGAADGCR